MNKAWIWLVVFAWLSGCEAPLSGDGANAPAFQGFPDVDNAAPVVPIREESSTAAAQLCRTALDCDANEQCVQIGLRRAECQPRDPDVAPAYSPDDRPTPPAGMLFGEGLRGKP